jgi:hypothetical protein
MRFRYLIAPILILWIGHSLQTGMAQEGEEEIIKLSKTVRCNTLDEAKMSLTQELLSPPIKLGAKREEVQARFGSPKEVIGFGTEQYKITNGTVTISYTTNDKGENIVNLVEFRPKREILWSNLLKPNVRLPIRGSEDEERVRLTVQIRIDDIGEKRSLHLTLIGNQRSVSFINWSLIF